MDQPESDLPWSAAQQMERWAGELRINLIRIAAIALFYGHHLFNQIVLKQEFPPRYTLAVTAIAVVWALGAVALHIALQDLWRSPALRFGPVGFDVVMTTSLLLISDGPRSPLLILLFLIVATAPLRLDLRVVWTATLLALLSYAFVCGHAKWVKPERQVPRRQEIVVALALAVAGVLAGQSVRQSRRLAQDYADRNRPEEPS